MGDFVGGTLKYLRILPVARLTIPGGFAKLATGHLDLHSARGQVDTNALGEMLAALGADTTEVEAARAAAGAAEILAVADARKAALAARRVQAREVALATLSGKTAVEVALDWLASEHPFASGARVS